MNPVSFLLERLATLTNRVDNYRMILSGGDPDWLAPHMDLPAHDKATACCFVLDLGNKDAVREYITGHYLLAFEELHKISEMLVEHGICRLTKKGRLRPLDNYDVWRLKGLMIRTEWCEQRMARLSSTLDNIQSIEGSGRPTDRFHYPLEKRQPAKRAPWG
jgi:hypothetical protein